MAAKKLSHYFPQMVSESEFKDVFLNSQLPPHIIERLSKVYTKMAKEMAMAFAIQSRIGDMEHFAASIDLHLNQKGGNKKTIEMYKSYCKSTLEEMHTVASRNTTFFHKENGEIPEEFFNIFN